MKSTRKNVSIGNKQLALKPETLRVLNSHEILVVRGGAMPRTDEPTCLKC